MAISPFTGFPGGSVVKTPSVNVGDIEMQASSLGRPPGGGNHKPLQSSCQENPKGRGAWQATAHGLESQT